MRFRDRADAGRQLAEALLATTLDGPVVVLALPRGGVPVAAEVAAALGAPLDVFVVRKVGAPHQPEYGIGAVAEGGSVVMDRSAVQRLGLDDDSFARLVQHEEREVTRRVERYRAGRPAIAVAGCDVVLVDDGLATGVTAEAALRGIQQAGPRRVVLAVPVCPAATARRLDELADDIVMVRAPHLLRSVGEWYDDFSQTSDDEVIRCLQLRADAHAAGR